MYLYIYDLSVTETRCFYKRISTLFNSPVGFLGMLSHVCGIDGGSYKWRYYSISHLLDYEIANGLVDQHLRLASCGLGADQCQVFPQIPEFSEWPERGGWGHLNRKSGPHINFWVEVLGYPTCAPWNRDGKRDIVKMFITLLLSIEPRG